MHPLLTHLAALEHTQDMLARADRHRLADPAAVTRPGRSGRRLAPKLRHLYRSQVLRDDLD